MSKHVHVTEQMWIPEVREDGVYLICAEDRSAVVKLCRPDHGSDFLLAGYIVGLQQSQSLKIAQTWLADQVQALTHAIDVLQASADVTRAQIDEPSRNHTEQCDAACEVLERIIEERRPFRFKEAP